MNIVMKPRAAEELQKVDIPEDMAIRIDASLEGGGCGCNIIYSMRLDRPQSADTVVDTDLGIGVIVSPSTIEWVGEEMTLNYLDNVGYTLANDEQTLTYGLKLKAATV